MNEDFQIEVTQEDWDKAALSVKYHDKSYTCACVLAESLNRHTDEQWGVGYNSASPLAAEDHYFMHDGVSIVQSFDSQGYDIEGDEKPKPFDIPAFPVTVSLKLVERIVKD